MNDIHYKIMRSWPFAFGAIWLVWGVLAPQPFLGSSHAGAHAAGLLGAGALFVIGLHPESKWIRVAGIMIAMVYPMHRAMALVFEQPSSLTLDRRIIAVSFSFLAVIALVALYPSLILIGRVKGRGSG